MKMKNEITESHVTSGTISSRVDLIHTSSSLPEIDFQARKWAIELLVHLTWEKLQTRKQSANTKTSLSTCPYFGFFMSPAKIALIIIIPNIIVIP